MGDDSWYRLFHAGRLRQVEAVLAKPGGVYQVAVRGRVASLRLHLDRADHWFRKAARLAQRDHHATQRRLLELAVLDAWDLENRALSGWRPTVLDCELPAPAGRGPMLSALRATLAASRASVALWIGDPLRAREEAAEALREGGAAATEWVASWQLLAADAALACGDPARSDALAESAGLSVGLSSSALGRCLVAHRLAVRWQRRGRAEEAEEWLAYAAACCLPGEEEGAVRLRAHRLADLVAQCPVAS